MTKKKTEIATTAADTYIALSTESTEISAEVAEANQETLGVNDLTRVGLNGDFFQVPNPLGKDEMLEEIEGVFAVYGFLGALWPTEGEAIPGTLPVLSSTDLKTAVQQNEDIGDLDQEKLDAAIMKDSEGNVVTTPGGKIVYDWTKLYYNEWGSSESGSGKGKRCKERRWVGILRAGDKWPILVNCPPTSLRNIRTFVKGLTKVGVPHYQTIVKLDLTEVTSSTGQPYSEVGIECVGQLSVEEAKFVCSRFSKPILAELNAESPVAG